MTTPRTGSKRMKKAAPKKGKVGLREIASAASVSVATASRVLSGNTRVARDIQKVVLDEARKLGIDPVQRNKTKALAFLLSNRAMLHAFHSRILIGAEAHCAANGWDMVFLSYTYSPNVPWTELHLPRVLQRHDVIRAVCWPAQTHLISSSCWSTRESLLWFLATTWSASSRIWKIMT